MRKWVRDWKCFSWGGRLATVTFVTNGGYTIYRQKCVNGLFYCVAEGKAAWDQTSQSRLMQNAIPGKDFKTLTQAKQWCDAQEPHLRERPKPVKPADEMLPAKWVYIVFYAHEPRSPETMRIDYIVDGYLPEAKAAIDMVWEQAKAGRDLVLEEVRYYRNTYKPATRELIKAGKIYRPNDEYIKMLDEMPNGGMSR